MYYCGNDNTKEILKLQRLKKRKKNQRWPLLVDITDNRRLIKLDAETFAPCYRGIPKQASSLRHCYLNSAKLRLLSYVILIFISSLFEIFVTNTVCFHRLCSQLELLARLRSSTRAWMTSTLCLDSAEETKHSLRTTCLAAY